MSEIDDFPYPTPIPAKIWGCSLWNKSVMLGSADRETVRLISHEIIFEEFQSVTTIPQRFGRTYRQLLSAYARGQLSAGYTIITHKMVARYAPHILISPAPHTTAAT